MTPALLAALLRARAERRVCVLATRIADGEQRLSFEAGADAVGRAVGECILARRSLMTMIDGEEWFLHLHAPAPRIIVVGAVHIAQSLAPMARLAGADVLVCDPRAAYATAERFPQTVLRHEWPDDTIRQEQPGPDCAVVALSHDPKIDDPALAAALETGCGYIGALGSRRSHAARLARLAERGVMPAALARIRGPVGLDIKAVGAGEIAVSILAEWIARRRGAG